jgi:hypothetical protein
MRILLSQQLLLLVKVIQAAVTLPIFLSVAFVRVGCIAEKGHEPRWWMHESFHGKEQAVGSF